MNEPFKLKDSWLSIAFTAWAGVCLYGVNQLENLHQEMAVSEELRTSQSLENARAIAELKANQQEVLRRLAIIEAKLK